jgi:hypothetical protein
MATVAERQKKQELNAARGSEVREWRERLDVQLGQIAKKARISVPMLSLFERGKINLSARAWQRVTRALTKIQEARREALKKYAQTVHSPTLGEMFSELELKFVLAPVNYVPPYDEALELLSRYRELSGMYHRQDIELRNQLHFFRSIAEGKTDRFVDALVAHIEELEHRLAKTPDWKKEVADLRRLVGLRTDAIAKTDEADALHQELQERIDSEKESDE